MAVTLKGVSVCWGVGMTATVGSVISATSLRQSADFGYTANTENLLDHEGKRKGMAFIDHERTITITVVPASTTKAAAAAELDLIVVAPGTEVTITAAHDEGDGDIAIAGSYAAEGSRIRETNNGATLLEIDLYRTSEVASYADIT